MMLIAKSRTVHRNQPRGVALAQVVSLLRPLRQFATHTGLQSFLCDDLLKDVAIETESATNRFNLLFFSRS